jgi:hypothetical protein
VISALTEPGTKGRISRSGTRIGGSVAHLVGRRPHAPSAHRVSKQPRHQQIVLRSLHRHPALDPRPADTPDPHRVAAWRWLRRVLGDVTVGAVGKGEASRSAKTPTGLAPPSPARCTFPARTPQRYCWAHLARRLAFRLQSVLDLHGLPYSDPLHGSRPDAKSARHGSVASNSGARTGFPRNHEPLPGARGYAQLSWVVNMSRDDIESVSAPLHTKRHHSPARRAWLPLLAGLRNGHGPLDAEHRQRLQDMIECPCLRTSLRRCAAASATRRGS